MNNEYDGDDDGDDNYDNDGDYLEHENNNEG
jgi:hypothetical protein